MTNGTLSPVDLHTFYMHIEIKLYKTPKTENISIVAVLKWSKGIEHNLIQILKNKPNKIIIKMTKLCI